MAERFELDGILPGGTQIQAQYSGFLQLLDA
jgi:hypothetical protein